MYLLYFVLWIIFNGAVTTEICIFGLVIAGVIFAFTCRFMDYSVKKEKQSVPAHFQNAAVHFRSGPGDHQGEFCSHSYDPLGKRGS